MNRAILALGLLAILLAAGIGAARERQAGGAVGGSKPPPIVLGEGPRRPTGTGVISGVVSDGHSGRPIAGALVYVGISGRGPAGSVSRQITDPRGRFVFTDLPESDSFFLNVSKAGFNDGHYGDTGPISGGVGAGLIKLGRGEWFREADIPMFRPGVIAGTLVDEAGEPVVGAYVRVLARIHVAGLPQLAAGVTVRTDDRGRYRLPGLAPGAYVVHVPSVQHAVPRSATPEEIEGIASSRTDTSGEPRRNRGLLDLDNRSVLIAGNYTTPPVTTGRAQAYPPVFAPGVSALAAATEIILEPGEVRESVAIALHPAPTVRVSGRIEGPEEARRGLVLRMVPTGLEGLGEGSEAATALVERGGEFEFVNVTPGQYTLMAQRTTLEYSQRTRFGGSQQMPRTPGLVQGPRIGLSGVASGPPGTQVLASSGAGDRSYFAQLPVGVGDSDITGVVVSLRRGATLRGRVDFDGDGNPPNPVMIVAEAADGSAAAGLHQSNGRVQPGSGDEFVFEGLPPGTFMVRVLGLTPLHAVRSIRSGGADLMDSAIDTSAGAPADLVVTVTDRVAALEGVVQTRGESGLFTVIAFPADRRLWSAYGLSAPRFKTAPVKNDGTYKIANIPAGDYLLVAVPAGHSRRWQDPAFLDAASSQASRVTAVWGQTVSQPVKPVVIK
jgi:hypothetical protein